ncbi:MAG: Kdo hydroxylase family protein [Acidobacteriota bacterium]
MDSFPTRPTGGDCILRFFVNINPREARQSVTTGPFDLLVREFAGGHRPPLPRDPAGWRLATRNLKRLSPFAVLGELAGAQPDEGLPAR